MSTNAGNQNVLPGHVDQPLSLREIGSLLVKHYGLHDGMFEISAEFMIGMGPVGPSPDALVPGVSIGITKIGLVRANENAGPTAIDAAKINPRPKKGLEKVEKPGLRRVTAASSAKKKTPA